MNKGYIKDLYNKLIFCLIFQSKNNLHLKKWLNVTFHEFLVDLEDFLCKIAVMRQYSR